MTYEAHPPKLSKSGRVVEIDGGKAFDLALYGNKALQQRFAAELARVHPGISRGARQGAGSAGSARTPAVGHGGPASQVRAGMPNSSHPGKSAVSPARVSRSADSGSLL